MGPGSVHATPRGDQIGLPGTYFGTLNTDGTFSIPNMPPGEYLVEAFSRFTPSPPGTPPRAQEIVAASVTVNGEDVTGVTLAGVNPVTVTGRIVFDSPSAAQSLTASAIQVLPILVKPDEGMPLLTPKARASYEAASTTPPRELPPTAIGRPRSAGSSNCSTDA